MDSCLNLCIGVKDFLYGSHEGREGDDTGVSISPFCICSELSEEFRSNPPLRNWSVVHKGGVGVLAIGGIPILIGLEPSGDPWFGCGDKWSPQELGTDITSEGFAKASPKLFPSGDVCEAGTGGLVIISVGAAPAIIQ